MENDILLEIPDRIRDIYSSCSDIEKQYLRQILEELSETGESHTYNDIWLADYKEIPVSVNTFISSELYLGNTTRNGQAVYPFWKKALNEIFDAGNKYNEVVFTGATRIGKTSTAITGAAYMLYRLMCLKNPQKFFNKKANSKFSLLFFNVTKDLAKGVAYREFNDTLRASPWFNNHGTFSKSERDFYYIPEGGAIDIDYGSSGEHGLGKQVFCSIMDECAFSKTGIKDINKAKAHMKHTYDTVSARIKGTFRQGGEVYGKLFAVSSKNSDSDFLESYIQEQLAAGAGEHMYITDAPQWEVLPSEMFHKETFNIAVGDRHKRGFVVPDNQSFPEAIEDLKQQGYRILTPPIDMRPEFIADFDIALRDLAGISVPGALSFITQDSLNACISSERKNPFYNEILQIGTKDNLTIEEFFHINDVDMKYKRAANYIHIDLSLNTDRTGISDVAGPVGRIDIKSDDGKVISQPLFVHVFSIALEAPRGDKMAYAKITAFLCWLRKSGFNISRISRDQFQSEYMAQLLESQGFTVDKLSLDRTPEGYIALRSMLLEQRIDMLDSKLLQDELIRLQRDSVTGKIDHPVGGCFVGDTKIEISDGRILTIYELLEEQKRGKTNCVYTYNLKTNRIEFKPILNVFQTKFVTTLVKVVLNNGYVLYCTPEHLFMDNRGNYIEAQNLTCNDYLMSLYKDRQYTISTVEYVNKPCFVYDLEVADNHNFALDAGIFVHNSKDVADSFAGSLWNASLNAPGVIVPVQTVAKTISSINRTNPYKPTQTIASAFSKLYGKK